MRSVLILPTKNPIIDENSKISFCEKMINLIKYFKDKKMDISIIDNQSNDLSKKTFNEFKEMLYIYSVDFGDNPSILDILRRNFEKGKFATVRYGFNLFSDRDFIFFSDGDLSYLSDTSVIDRSLEILEKGDTKIVKGNRNTGGYNSKRSFSRKLITLARIYTLLLVTKVPDTQCGFFGFKNEPYIKRLYLYRNDEKEIQLKRLWSGLCGDWKFFSISEKLGYKIENIPIYHYNTGSASNINLLRDIPVFIYEILNFLKSKGDYL
ncbi:MAG: glycosyltransferase [Candidatus Aenigmarchaeota archaeon]|nr:glycosyltransferase [Candidatus Aenigmarchaeota archaeon]